MKLVYLFIFGLLILTACQSEKKQNILDKQTYKEVLKEIILSNTVQQDFKNIDSLPKNLIALIYKKYNIDSLKLQRTTNYYTSHPEELMTIYDEIYKELKQVSDSLEKLHPDKKPKTDKISIPEKGILKKLQKKIKNK